MTILLVASTKVMMPVQALAHPASNLVPREEAVTPRKMGKYTIMPATWTGPIFPGGSNVTFTDKSILVSKFLHKPY